MVASSNGDSPEGDCIRAARFDVDSVPVRIHQSFESRNRIAVGSHNCLFRSKPYSRRVRVSHILYVLAARIAVFETKSLHSKFVGLKIVTASPLVQCRLYNFERK